MVNNIRIGIGIIIVLLIARHLRGYFASNVPKPSMTPLAQYGDISIRQMSSQIYATVTIAGKETEVNNEAFRILAGFIFGKNTSRTSVEMTAPVISQKNTENNEKISMTAPVITQKQSQKISMTAPVVSQKNTKNNTSGAYDVSFLMPEQYTLDTLPVPNDKRISLHTRDPHTVAVVSFNAYTNSHRIEKYRHKLLQGLDSLQITTRGESVVAQYNDPWTPPLMRTNEIWIEIDPSTLPPQP